jgi:hypothetical protein
MIPIRGLKPGVCKGAKLEKATSSYGNSTRYGYFASKSPIY